MEDTVELSEAAITSGKPQAFRVFGGSFILGWAHGTVPAIFASHLVMKGTPLKVVQELLGHATIEMTMRYSHLSPEISANAVKVLDTRGQQEGNMREVSTASS
jgi:hypothetical protein